jgi:tetratricopeptide (TPR) repeat protein
LVTARELGDRQREIMVIGNLGNAYYQLSQFKEASELFEQGLLIAREFGSKGTQVFMLRNLGTCCAQLGDKPGGVRLLEEALAIAREINDDVGETYVVNFLSQVYRAMGKADEAAKLNCNNGD